MSIIGNPIMAGASGPAASIFVTGLSETDTVTATNGSKTLTGKWTQKPNPLAHGLPDGYTELEYIESTGTQYIDTGIIPSQNFVIDITGIINQSASGDWLLGSCYDTSDDRIMGIAAFSSSPSYGNIAVIQDAGWSWQATQFSALEKHRIVMGKNYVTVDDSTMTVTGSVSEYKLSIGLFTGNFNGDFAKSGFIGKSTIYECKIYDDTTILGDFVPAKRNSDGAIGMYDRVTNLFFENGGTGTFVAGSEVSQTIDGFLIKPIRDFGTWTVTATDGTDTYTQDVLVDVFTVYEIEITKKLYLYRDGDECEDVTGGWTGKNVEGTNTFTKDSDSLYIAVAGTGVGVTFNTNNMINLTGYTKLYAECISTKGNAFCGLANYIMNDRSGSERYKIVWGETTRKVLSIDLDTTESKYAYIGSITSEYASNNIRLYKMWLE